MKVLMLNGSPHKEGCTYTALCVIAGELNKLGVESEIFHIGKKPITGCQACGACSKPGAKGCAFGADGVNEFVEKAKEADGFVFGSPVHYAAASGAISSFLDRAFYSGKSAFEYKPGAAIVSCRRAGSTAALEELNKYMTISNMPLVSSNYWNMVHGRTPDDVRQDLEGIQIMRLVGRNMAWLLKSIEAVRAAGIPLPEHENKIFTNFIK